MPEWLYGILIGSGIVGLVAIVWRAHERRDDERFDAIWDQIGRSSEEGMRRSVHMSGNLVQTHEARISMLERK